MAACQLEGSQQCKVCPCPYTVQLFIIDLGVERILTKFAVLRKEVWPILYGGWKIQA